MNPGPVSRVPRGDLHRHLLGSARVDTLWDYARREGHRSVVAGFDAFRSEIVHRSRPKDLAEYISPWVLFRELIREPDDIRRIAREAAADAAADGVSYVEFRTSLPGMPATDGTAPQTRIPPEAFLTAIRAGFAEVRGVESVVVASIPRHIGGLQSTTDIEHYTDVFLETVSTWRGFIVGVDLTGIEHGSPVNRFRYLFLGAREMGFPITIHAGETEGPREIWRAIELGARRIGHGTSAPSDPALVGSLARDGIVLEVCPTSSWLVGGSSARDRHPVIESSQPIPYVVCTDNPTINASPLSSELRLAAKIAGVAVDEFENAQWQAIAKAAFSPEAVIKAALSNSTSSGRPEEGSPR